jgi:hypothetical protein
MAAETITVYIDQTQLPVLQSNNLSLLLAKTVNGECTVIWKSFGPKTVAGQSGYEYVNRFYISVPNYEVNFSTVEDTNGSVTFSAGGKNTPISIGQKIRLDGGGVFGVPTQDGSLGEIIIDNQLQNYPHAILLDNNGGTIFVNFASGMGIGVATLTPVDSYQIWFQSDVDVGTAIVNQGSNLASVVFDGTTASQTITYDSAGTWRVGGLPAYRA